MFKTSSIHVATIEAVRQVATENIVEIVADTVVLKKSGKEYMGKCPFHDDSTPSFGVNPTKGVYHCHGCGEGGDAIAFFRKTNSSEFAQAIESLAERFNIPIQYNDSNRDYQKEKSLLDEMREIHNLAVAYYQRQLNLSPVAKQYLSDRKLTPETATHWKLGYAPDSWDGLLSHLISKNFSPEAIERAGFIIKRESGGYYDRFRNRLMVPISNEKGEVIAFTGRTLCGDQAKYLNSPETLLFQKGRVLFGLDKAKEAIASANQAIVVEGHLDVISLHQAGICNVVGAMGTALSQQQVKQACRYTALNHVVLGFDSDQAGVTATHKAITELTPLAGSIDLKILTLPEGKDADEFVTNHGADAYKSLAEKALSWIEWKFQQICTGDLADAQVYQQAATQILEILNSLDITAHAPAINRAAQILASRSGYSISSIMDGLRKAFTSRSVNKVKAKPVAPTQCKPERSVLETAELTVLAIYQNAQEYQAAIKGEMEKREINFSHCRELFTSLHGGDYEAIAALNEKHGIASVWATVKGVEESLIRCLNYLQIQQLNKQRRYCLDRWAQAGENERDREYYDAQHREACAEIEKLRRWEPVKGESLLKVYYQPVEETAAVEQVELTSGSDCPKLETVVDTVETTSYGDRQKLDAPISQIAKPSPVDEKRDQLIGLAFRKLQNAKSQRDIESISRQYAGVVQETWSRLPQEERDRLSTFDLTSLNLSSHQEFLNQYLEDLEKGAIASQEEALSLFEKAEQIGASLGDTLGDYWQRVSVALGNFLERTSQLAIV